MEFDADNVDDAVLALIHLNAFDDGHGVRAWKSYDWAALDRLHEKGLIGNPKSKAKSVSLTDAGARQAEEAFSRLFGADDRD